MALNIPLPSANFGEQVAQASGNLLSKLMANRNANALRPSGDVANALYVEQMKERYGENHPLYLEAKKAHQLGLDARMNLINYRDTLGATAPYRATSPLGKSIAEGQGRGALDVIGGTNNYNALGQKITQKEPEPYDDEKARAYEMDISKKTTDSDARKRYNFAVNVDKTRERINPEDLLAYTGLEGMGRKLRDESMTQSGKAPERLLAHKKAVAAANLLAKQVRQFYGESIQPDMAKKLEKLTNPATWYKNPKVALAEYEAFNDILDAETQTYKEAGTSPINLRKKEQKVEPQQEIANDEMGFLNAVSPQLIDVMPEATPENIIKTAQQSGKSVNEVVQFLINKRKMMLFGGQ